MDSLLSLSEEPDSIHVAQRILSTQQLANLQKQLDSFYYQVKLDFYAGLDLAINQLQLVSPQSTYESNEKSYLNIFLNSLRYNEGRITESQGDILHSIATQCPSFGGYSVMNSRNLLPYCYTDFNEFCNETVNIPYGEQSTVYLGNIPLIGSNHFSNQADSQSSLSVDSNNLDLMSIENQYEIYNLSGQKIKSSNNPIVLRNLVDMENGIYFLITKDVSGNKKVSKFAILR